MAAKGEATLLVRLVDAATKPLQGLKGQLDLLKRHWLAVTATVGAFAVAIGSAIRAAAEAELAENKLAQALRNQGVSSQEAVRQLTAHASKLQALTATSDEAITESMALLTTFGLMGQPLKDATKAALDLSAGLGIDLKAAVMLVGKAASGETSALGRYGIAIKDGLPPSERFAAVLQQIGARFGGAAEANAKTFTGRLAALGLAFDDLKERIGRMLIGPASELVTWMTSVVKGVEDIRFSFAQWKADRNEKAIASLRGELKALADDSSGKKITDFLFGADQLTPEDKIARMKEIVAEIKRLKGEMAAGRETGAGAPPGGGMPDRSGMVPPDETIEAEKLKLQELARAKIDQMTLAQDEIEAKEAEHLAARLIATQQYELAVDVLRASAHQKEMAQMAARKAAGMRALSDLSSLQQSKSKEMAAVGKAAAISQATIDTYVGAQAAYKALAGIPVVGPFLATAAAAAAITAGLARVAAIQGTPLATGGVVMPTSGGTLATIGEAGRPEAVIPLGDSRAVDTLRGAGLGETHIHIAEGGVFVGDQRGVQELARMIDDELFRMERNRKAVG